MIVIDGSFGEGGGQIVRTALALSLLTGQPCRLYNIRARRRRPGLLRQHLSAVRVAAQIGQADLEGDSLGSQLLVFRPKTLQGGDFHIRIGSAGSCTLVLQTVLPALITADRPSTLTIEGGTHNPFAPPFDFLVHAFLPILRKMGAQVEATLERAGFYPAGGGRLRVSIEPVSELQPFRLLERGEPTRLVAKAFVANLPLTIAQREIAALEKALPYQLDEADAAMLQNAYGPGNIVYLVAESPAATEVFTGFGRRGVRAEKVAAGVAEEAAEYLQSDAAVARHLADQLLIPMALARGGTFATLSLSDHTTTNIAVIQKFLDVRFSVKALDTQLWQVQLAGSLG